MNVPPLKFTHAEDPGYDPWRATAGACITPALRFSTAMPLVCPDMLTPEVPEPMDSSAFGPSIVTAQVESWFWPEFWQMPNPDASAENVPPVIRKCA